MTLIQRAGEEAVLPEVTASTVEAVDVLAIQEMGSAHRLGQAVFAFWPGDQVNVIRHQAEAENLETEALAELLEGFQVEPPIVIGEEDIFAVIASLGDVVRDPRHNDPSDSWHRRRAYPAGPALSRNR